MDDIRGPENLAGWLHQIAAYAPELFSDGVPSPEALRIAESCETWRNGDSAGNWSSIITTGTAIAANAFTVEREHGSVNPTRAGVDRLKREYDRDPVKVGRAVDPWVARDHQVKRRRSHKGNQNDQVVKYGVAPVIGSIDAPDPDDIRAAMASHLLGYVRSVALGLNGQNVCQVATGVYGAELDAVEVGQRADGSIRYSTLVGTEVEARKQVFDPYHPACFEPIAEHNQVTRHLLPRQGVEYVTPVEVGPAYGPRRPVVIWQAHANCSHTDATRRASTSRIRLPRVKARKSEANRIEPRKVLCIMRRDGVTTDLSTTRCPMIAPHVDTGKAWFGHRLFDRGTVARKNPTRADARAARRAVVSRTLPDVTIDSLAGWQALADDFAPGRSERVRVNGRWVLAMSRSPHAGKYNVKVYADAPVGATGHVALNIQVRSAATVARRLHATITD
jgi:hypothetical protein